MERTHDDEEDGQHCETHELDGFTAPGINEKEGDPVSWNQAGGGENQISFADVVQVIVDSASTLCDRSSETDCLENDCRVETKTVECNLGEVLECKSREIERDQRQEQTKSRRC